MAWIKNHNEFETLKKMFENSKHDEMLIIETYTEHDRNINKKIIDDAEEKENNENE